MPNLDPNAFEVHRDTLDSGVEIAYVREGVGGYPLLLLHGWPETKRIWWQNIGPLSELGFEVIAVDLRGFGDSSAAPDGFYDVASHSTDLSQLLAQLGISKVVTSGADWGGGVAQDFCQRFPELVERQVLFNTVTPMLHEEWEKAGVGGDQMKEASEASEHMESHGKHADELAARLDTEQKRRDYVKGFYQERPLSHLGNFDDASADFVAEPFVDADTFRSSLVIYEAIYDESKLSAPPLLDRKHTIPTLALWGESDRMAGDHWTTRMEIACPDIVGPFKVERAGHFLQWERAELLNKAFWYFCRDLAGQ